MYSYSYLAITLKGKYIFVVTIYVTDYIIADRAKFDYLLSYGITDKILRDGKVKLAEFVCTCSNYIY